MKRYKKKIKMKKSKILPITLASLALVMGGGVLVNDFNTNPAVSVSAKEATTATIADATTVWSYLDDNTDPASGLGSLSAWTTKSFDDSNWKTASGSFGAKKGQLADVGGFTPTVLLNQYYEDGKDTPTFFFRTKVNITNVSEITALTGSLYADDEVKVFINGNEVYSELSKQDNGTNLYYSGHGQGSPDESVISLSTKDCQDYLVEGENVIAFEVHNDRETSSDIYAEMRNMQVTYNGTITGMETDQKEVILTIGSDESSRYVTWYADDEAAGELQYAKASEVVNGVFPANAKKVTAATSKANDTTYFTNQALMEGLEENTEYVYRVVNGDKVSDTYSFKTQEFDGSFSFVLAGDPQIGAGGNNVKDGEGWDATLETVVEKFNPSFLLSAGDQVNTSNSEEQYSYYINDKLASLTSATTIGNHDSSSSSYGQHFALPNESASLGITNAGSDYYYVYNNTLFMVLNSNNKSTAEHKEFMEQAIAATADQDITWKTVVFHHSIYSTASHYDDSDIITRRQELPGVFDDLDIDVVLMGHDHVYARTYMMEDGYTPVVSNESSTTDPEGILYITANSASGSKYYDLRAADAEYVAKTDQSYRRTVSNITVTDTSYTVTTYYADTMEQLDTYTINKSVAVDAEKLTNLISKVQNTDTSKYTEDSVKNLNSVLDEALALLKTDYTQDQIDDAYIRLSSAYNSLELIKTDNKTENTDKEEAKETSGNVDTGDHSEAAAYGLLLFGSLGAIILNRKKKKA